MCVCMFDLRPFTLRLCSLTLRATHPYDKESTISMISKTNELKCLLINRRRHKLSIQEHVLYRLTDKFNTALFQQCQIKTLSYFSVTYISQHLNFTRYFLSKNANSLSKWKNFSNVAIIILVGQLNPILMWSFPFL